MRLTNALVSGTISARNGGFAVALYLCRYYYMLFKKEISFLPKVALYLCRYYYRLSLRYNKFVKTLHLTYAGIITQTADIK